MRTIFPESLILATYIGLPNFLKLSNFQREGDLQKNAAGTRLGRWSSDFLLGPPPPGSPLIRKQFGERGEGVRQATPHQKQVKQMDWQMTKLELQLIRKLSKLP